MEKQSHDLINVLSCVAVVAHKGKYCFTAMSQFISAPTCCTVQDGLPLKVGLHISACLLSDVSLWPPADRGGALQRGAVSSSSG